LARPRQQALSTPRSLSSAHSDARSPERSVGPTGSERHPANSADPHDEHISVPYFVLSSTGPLLQAWFARAFPAACPIGCTPIDIGSTARAASYPFFSSHLRSPWQAQLWTCGFIVYAGLCAYSMAISSVGQATPDIRPEAHPSQSELQSAPPPALYAFWLIMAAFGFRWC